VEFTRIWHSDLQSAYTTEELMCGVHGLWKSQSGSSLRNWCHGIDHAQEVQAYDSHLGSQGEHFLHILQRVRSQNSRNKALHK